MRGLFEKSAKVLSIDGSEFSGLEQARHACQEWNSSIRAAVLS